VAFVPGTRHNGDWKGRQREQQRVQMEALLLGKGSRYSRTSS
jgi:hypothetical protein